MPRSDGRCERTTRDLRPRPPLLRSKERKAAQQTARASRDAAAGGRRARLRGLGSFGSEVVTELRKVNWPDRRTVTGYTVVVLANQDAAATPVYDQILRGPLAYA